MSADLARCRLKMSFVDEALDQSLRVQFRSCLTEQQIDFKRL